MASVINTNISSLNAQRNLTSSQSSLNVSIQRLSTGLRVNSAKDDAAGLAIAERMNAQVKGLNVAARNANDGVSLAQTAEGALGKIGDMVQRMRELAVQSSNATNTAEDRGALQEEVVQLKAEIDRVADTTNFNSNKLLDGSFTNARFQVGADAGQSITISGITNAKLEGLATTVTKDATMTGTALTAHADGAAIDGANFKINGVEIDVAEDTDVDSVDARLTQIADAINAADFGDDPAVTATVVDGAIQLSSTADIEVAGSAAGDAGLTAGTSKVVKDMSQLDISSYDGAQLAIEQADAALKQINSTRAKLGAVQSRFENAVSNIQIASENTTAARSRIMDTDFAAETASMTRAQILQQAGTAMLSQANQLPQQVLSLLR